MALLDAPVQKCLENIVFFLSHYLADLTVINENTEVNTRIHGRRNFKDTNPLMSSLLVILFGVVKQFFKF
jgi:hypothetical protein